VAKAEWRPARGFWTFWSSRSTGERKASPTLQFRGPVHDCLLECSECRPGIASCHCSHAFRPIWEVRIAGLSWRVDFLSVRAKLYRNSSVQNNILNWNGRQSQQLSCPVANIYHHEIKLKISPKWRADHTHTESFLHKSSESGTISTET